MKGFQLATLRGPRRRRRALIWELTYQQLSGERAHGLPHGESTDLTT